MARITVEDCLEIVPNRFSLVLVSAERTKQLLNGSQALIQNEGENKEVVTALREIAAGKFDIDESEEVADDSYKPSHRQRPAEEDEELPPEA